ncbi:MAG: macro domain-containing protein [Desulfamplus sp.]|nr:macro domain-containing protein [Desulfamplus sp.]
MAEIIEINGNIFNTTYQTIVNTVNCVGVMGKGIALEFKNRHPDMYQAYLRLCLQKKIKIGMLQLWSRSTPWVLNFPTKDNWKYPSKLEYVERGLVKFAQTYTIKGITSIAFPELGTSAGGLNWSDVKELMFKYLEPLTNLKVEIYHYDPSVQDNTFENLYQKVHSFDIKDYKKYIDLSPSQAKTIKDLIKNRKVHSMQELQNIKGVGDKTITKLYTFLNDSQRDQQRIETYSEIPSLPGFL